MLDKSFVDILCCPETKENVSIAEEALIAKVNDRIRKGQMKNRAGAAVTEPIEAGLIREDRQYLYAVRNGIPVMLIDEALPVKDLV
ncbi:MAG: hypothetical protein WCU74_03800 [Candidatus Omnitrophota bacterium]